MSKSTKYTRADKARIKVRKKAIKLIKREIDIGRQAYVVYPVIEESETQAMKAAQMANSNAGAMAPPPMMAGLPPPSQVTRFGDAGGGPAAPSLAPGVAAPLTDYGNPGDNAATFGPQKHGRIDGALAGRMGTPNLFK